MCTRFHQCPRTEIAIRKTWARPGTGVVGFCSPGPAVRVGIGLHCGGRCRYQPPARHGTPWLGGVACRYKVVLSIGHAARFAPREACAQPYHSPPSKRPWDQGQTALIQLKSFAGTVAETKAGLPGLHPRSCAPCVPALKSSANAKIFQAALESLIFASILLTLISATTGSNHFTSTGCS